jgi:sodium-dependent phosphate cotransporter
MTSSEAPLSHVRRGLPGPARAALVVGLVYSFLVGVSSLEAGINLMGEDVHRALFETVTNPLAGLFVGILGTVMVQSSSASTSLIVGLVASGVIEVDTAVPMIMGANIGTTVTSTLVAFGHIRQSIEFQRAFAAASIHDFFNVFAVVLLLPLELATGVLGSTAEWLSDRLVGTSGAEWESPVKKLVETPVGWVGDLAELTGTSGTVLGLIQVALGMAVILVALVFITKNMRRLVADRVERALNALLAKGGGLMAILVGMVITIAVQSSSITTSILVPLAGAGVLSLRSVFPVTLGANIGTTATALLAAMAASRPEALTIALVHTLFNAVGTLIIYPFPSIRQIPLRAAEGLAALAVAHKKWAIAYVVVSFIVVPAIGVLLLR